MLSGLRLADNISTIALQALPVYASDLANKEAYVFGEFHDSDTSILEVNGSITLNNEEYSMILSLPEERSKATQPQQKDKRSLRIWLRSLAAPPDFR